MKINTREKLQILMFGLKAGRNLDVIYSGGNKLTDGSTYPIFSNDDLQFTLDFDGTIKSDIDDSSELADMYAARGCLSCAIEEANELYPRIFKLKKRLEDL